MRVVTTFPARGDLERVAGQLDALGLRYDVISPEPGYGLVGEPALVMDQTVRLVLAGREGDDVGCAGWVEYRPARLEVPTESPKLFDDDLFGRAAVMVLASCIADETKIRLVAHISGDLAPAFPYLNAEMPQACYNARGPTFTFMDGYRMVTVYAGRIAVAKADEIIDAWRVLEDVRCRANDAWRRRTSIEPSYEMRQKPPALEIYKRLPRTNCGRCGEPTCLAFAVKVHGGQLAVSLCRPAFEGKHAGCREALIEICKGLGAAL